MCNEDLDEPYKDRYTLGADSSVIGKRFPKRGLWYGRSKAGGNERHRIGSGGLQREDATGSVVGAGDAEAHGLLVRAGRLSQAGWRRRQPAESQGHHSVALDKTSPVA